MLSPDEYPRPLSRRERRWCAMLLPADRPGYAAIASLIAPLQALGIGRWGEGDLILGNPGELIEADAPAEPIVSVGLVKLQAPDGPVVLDLSIHEPDPEGHVELRLSGVVREFYEVLPEVSCWSLSSWKPGMASPATGAAVRETALDGSGSLVLAIDRVWRRLWLFDGAAGTSRLVPVTNFYNELMLLAGERDPGIALNHGRLFDALDSFSDEQLAEGFRRYNRSFRKVDPDRMPESRVEQRPESGGLLGRIAAILGGRST